MLDVIWTEPDFGEWMFLLATIIFVIAAVLDFLARSAHTTDHPAGEHRHVRAVYTIPLIAIGLAVFALGFLAL